MLPYGIALWNDLLPPRPAELRDIPLGTHLHGSFCLPPTGEEKTIPSTMGPPQYGSKYNHAVLLEDDFSFFQRRGLAWRVVEIDRSKGRLEVAASGKTDGVEFQKEHNFWIDHVEHLGGSQGIVTITLFGGMDPSLYDEVKSKEAHGNAVGVAENTLCT